MTWSEAKASCIDHGGDLASVGNEEEQQVLKAGIFETAGGWWIGFSDQQTEGTFVWSDGTVTEWTNWFTVRHLGYKKFVDVFA